MIFKFKVYISILIIILLLLSSSCVYADDTYTFTVGSKHIIGNDGGGIYGGKLFLISETYTGKGVDGILADYLVHSQDYYKIHEGDTVTLSMPDKYGYCDVLKINNQEDTDGAGWWGI